MGGIQEPWEVFTDRERWEATLERRRERARLEEERDWDDYLEPWELYDDE